MAGSIIAEIPGFYRVVALTPFRRTEGVSFDIVPMDSLPGIDGIDRVIHRGSAVSPGPVGEVARPWYLHFHQEDNLLVLQGTRTVDIYTVEHGRVETFIIEPERIQQQGKTILDGPGMVVWPCNVFHRIVSGPQGSASLNFARRYAGFDVRTNFSIYDLDTATGKHRVIREGHLDQQPV